MKKENNKNFIINTTRNDDKFYLRSSYIESVIGETKQFHQFIFSVTLKFKLGNSWFQKDFVKTIMSCTLTIFFADLFIYFFHEIRVRNKLMKITSLFR